MTNVIQFSKKTTFERLLLDEKSTVTNLAEGFCFRYHIPKQERQLVTFFSGLSCSNNFEAVISWVRNQFIKSGATSEAELREEVEIKFEIMIEQLYMNNI